MILYGYCVNVMSCQGRNQDVFVNIVIFEDWYNNVAFNEMFYYYNLLISNCFMNIIVIVCVEKEIDWVEVYLSQNGNKLFDIEQEVVIVIVKFMIVFYKG